MPEQPQEARSAAQGHEDEWNITYEHVDPNDPLVAAPRWREALEMIAAPPVVGDQSSIETLAFCVRTARAALGLKDEA